MAFKLPQINLKLPNLNEYIRPEAKQAYQDVKSKVENTFQQINTFDPQFDPATFKPNLLKKIDETPLPGFLKTPAKFMVNMFTEDPEDSVKKQRIIDEIKSLHPQEQGNHIEGMLNAPWGFAMLDERTIKKLSPDLQFAANKYKNNDMMNVGFSIGSVQEKGTKMAAPLLENLKTKFEKLFGKGQSDFVDQIPGATKKAVSLNQAEKIAASTFEKFKADPENPVFKDETKKLFQQIGDLLGSGDMQVEDLPKVLDKYNLTSQQFADMYIETISTSGKQLNRLSQLRKRMIQTFPDLEDKLSSVELKDPGPWNKVSEVFRSIENTRRGLLTSQLATTARNILSQSTRYTLQFADDVLTGAMETVTGRRPPKDAFIPAMEDIFSIGRQFSPEARRKLANTIEEFPVQKYQLFGTPTGEVSLGGKITSTVNAANTAQEYFFRKMRMDALLNTHLTRGGGEITDTVMQNWVDDALDLTFAKKPEGGFLGKVYETFNHPFFTAVGNPFIRFWANSVKFLWDFSPGGFTKLLSSDFRQQLTSPNADKAYSALSKAVLGSMMLGGAVAIRNSDSAGEKWYEVNMPNGKTWDTRAFAPFSTYLFLAEAMKPDNNLTGMDYLQGAVSINRIAGSGLVIVDIVRSNDAEGVVKNVKDFMGQYISGFTVPFRTVKDFIAQYDPSEGAYKDTSEAPILGPALENIPYATKDFPTSPRATRPEPFSKEDPLIRQLTGMTLKTKTPLEREIDRLGVPYTTLYPKTGYDKMDRAITRKVGAVMDVVGNAIVEQDFYKKMGDYDKTELLKNIYSAEKSDIKKEVIQNNAAQIAAGIYAEIKNMDMEDRRKFFDKLKNKGLMKPEIIDFVIKYMQAKPDQNKLDKTLEGLPNMELSPRIFGVQVP